MSIRPTCLARRRLASLALLAPAAATLSRPLRAADAWPSRPVRLVVPFPPGGATDTIARLIAHELQKGWQQPVTLDHKPGAGTIVGTDAVAKAAPDGYTLGMAILSHLTNPALQPSLPYDTLRDLAGVSQVAFTHFGVFAHPSFEARTLPELIALAKRSPGRIAFASTGIGNGTHLTGELLEAAAGIDLVHVPYKGSAQAQQDVVGGRVPLLIDVLASALPFVTQGRLRPIALASPARASVARDIPTIAETLPGFSAVSVIGVIVAAGTPREIVERIGADVARAARAPDVVERMASLGAEAVGSSPAQYDALIRAEIEKWTRVIRTAGIRLE